MVFRDVDLQPVSSLTFDILFPIVLRALESPLLPDGIPADSDLCPSTPSLSSWEPVFHSFSCRFFDSPKQLNQMTEEE